MFQYNSSVVKFIGTPGTAEQIRGAVEFASVENMRAMETKGTFWKSGSRMVAKDASNPDSFKVRKAKVGGYRDYFDDAQVLEMQALVKRELAAFKANRDGESVRVGLERLREAARGEENLFPYVLEAFRRRATLGEVCGVLREEWGEYQPPR